MKEIELGKLISQVNKKNKVHQIDNVYSVTNSEGFIPSTEYFEKKVFSKDLSNYRIVNKGQFAYNPSRINVGSIDYLKVTVPVVISPLYVVFECDSQLHPAFLKYFLKSPLGNTRIRAKTQGGVRDTLSFKNLSKIKIPLLELDDQKRIAKVLSNCENLIQKRKESIELVDEYLKSTFLELFGDPSKNPHGWEQRTLSELCHKITDGTHHSPPIEEKGVPYITAKHVKENKIDFWSNPWYVSKAEHEKIYSRCNPEKGDVLYIKDGATTGKSAINEYDFEFSMLSSLALIKPNKDVLLSEFLNAWLNNERVKRINIGKMAGGAIKRLTLKKIKSLKVFVAPMDLQIKFAGVCEMTTKLQSNNRESLKEIENLYGSISQKAFKGELDLSKVEFNELDV